MMDLIIFLWHCKWHSFCKTGWCWSMWIENVVLLVPNWEQWNKIGRMPDIGQGPLQNGGICVFWKVSSKPQ